MKFSNRVLLAAALSVAVVTAPIPLAAAPNPPVSGYPPNVDIGAVVTNTLRTAGTFTAEPGTANTQWRGVLCTLKVATESGSPSTTFSIQGYDSANAIWQTIATSGAVTGTTNPGAVLIYPGAALTTTPTGWVLNAVHLPPRWRVSQTIGGTGGPAITGKVGCSYLN